MSSRSSQQLVGYYICPAGNGHERDGSAAQPFRDLDEALSGIAERHQLASVDGDLNSSFDQIEVASIGAPGRALKASKAARYEFFIDPLAGSEAGDGGPSAPWPDLGTALTEVARLRSEGQLALAPGERLRLSRRKPFAATPMDSKKRRRELVAKLVLMAMTWVLVLPLAAILTYLVVKAWPVLSLSFLFENPRNNMTAGGIWAPLVGTFYLVFVSLIVAAPIGILAGVYLNEYARENWFTRIVNLAVVNLAGVPSIVHALFGVGAFVTFAHMGESVLAASCTLAIMTLPVIITSTREALASVPQSFRDACWNMGASRWQTIRTIVLPNSISGILTGVILQVSRTAGETAAILFTGAAFFVNVPNHGWEYFFPYGLNDSCMALSYHLHTVMTQVRPPSPEQIASGESMPLEQLQYGTAVVLIGLVLAVNSMSIGLRAYLRSRKKW